MVCEQPSRDRCALRFFLRVFVRAAQLLRGSNPLRLRSSAHRDRTMELTQGFSTTIHSERPFGKISITDPDIVDLVLRTDKSAVLIPQRAWTDEH